MGVSMTMVLNEVGGELYGRLLTYPVEMITKSASPVTTTTGTPCFITRGRTSHAEGALVSPGPTKTEELHSDHCTSSGA
jgi:hypothetical protein